MLLPLVLLLVLLLGSVMVPKDHTVDQEKTFVAQVRGIIGTYHNEEDDTLRFEEQEISAVDKDLQEIDDLDADQDEDFLVIATRLHTDMNVLAAQDRSMRMVQLI